MSLHSRDGVDELIFELSDGSEELLEPIRLTELVLAGKQNVFLRVLKSQIVL